ncbi:MAG: type II toxin-antitoxin system HicB family antitoxin, partial [Oscillospiraceae bacterium]
MRKVTYFAVFEPSGDGYSVYFPDLPGCISFGDSFEAAQKEAADALGLHLYGMEKDGEEIPAPSKVPIVDPDSAPG